MPLWRSVVCAVCLLVSAAAGSHVEEGRGKKKKIALLIYFADLVLKKVFVFKLIYAFVLWAVIHKAGYFLSWFISYLKEQKQHHEHTPHHHEYGPPHYEYGPPHYEYGPPHREYGVHDPYQRQSRYDK